ncbi:MAG: type II secretion system F family protein [Rhodospirillales bacterium]|nr:type II secretion system F family protein [Rhodospirillales bacterium]
MDLPTIITILTAAGAFISVLAVGLPLVQKDELGARLKAVAARRQELSQKQQAAFQQKTRFQPKRHVGLMKAVLDRLKLQNMLEAKDLKKKLAQAGWRRQSAAVTFTFSRIAAPIVLTIVTLIFVSSAPEFASKAFATKLLICAGAALVGFFLPAILLQNAITKRQQVLSRAFPDALDLLVICVDAGLSIEAAFSRVTEEMAEGSPEMAEEMGLTSAELAFLGDRRLAYENLAERTGLAYVKSLVTALSQAEKYGTSISNSLRVIAQETRDVRMSAAEKKAAALPAKLTVPMIVFFLPVLFMVIAGPAGIQVSAKFGGG